MDNRQKLSLVSLIIGLLALLFSALKLATDATTYYYYFDKAVEEHGGLDYGEYEDIEIWFYYRTFRRWSRMV